MNPLKNAILSGMDIFRPVLSDRTIRKMNAKGLLVEQPLTEEQIQPNSIDLTLADTVKILKSNAHYWRKDFIDPRLPAQYIEDTFQDNKELIPGNMLPIKEGVKYYVVEPGKFVLMASREILNIPNGILSFVQGRSSIARLAIQTEQAGLIDAGFRGTITFEVKNQSDHPIILFTGMRVAQVHFLKAQFANVVYGALGKNSKYSDQIKATGSRIHLDPEWT